MTAFLASLLFFSNKRKVGIRHAELANACLRKFDNKSCVIYWFFVSLFIIFTFTGEVVTNTSGSDNFELYMSNLDNQSGALEYFFIIALIGISLSKSNINKAIFILINSYYLYFTFTRGYRVQMLECLIMLIMIFFYSKLSLNRIFILAAVGFIVLQIHGAMKHGVEDIFSAASIFLGSEIRTNQTEVFYTSNNVINAIYDGQIFLYDRIASAVSAAAALFIPASFLPDIWHSTISANRITGLPGGGGGFISGHYFYWLSFPGIVLSGFVIAKLFSEIDLPRSNFTFYLSLLLITTFPRWIAYEPIALFYRSGFYFILFWFFFHIVIYQSISPSRNLKCT
jgi:hypothetical protein